MRTLLLAGLCTLPLFSSCVAAVAVGAGLVISQEVLDNNTYVSHVQQDVSVVWPEVKTFLSDSSLDLVEIDEELRVAKAHIDGAMVTVSVEAFDIDYSVLKVSAKKYGVSDGKLAGVVMERIHRRLMDHM
jgi:hypothetical protein